MWNKWRFGYNPFSNKILKRKERKVESGEVAEKTTTPWSFLERAWRKVWKGYTSFFSHFPGPRFLYHVFINELIALSPANHNDYLRPLYHVFFPPMVISSNRQIAPEALIVKKTHSEVFFALCGMDWSFSHNAEVTPCVMHKWLLSCRKHSPQWGTADWN